MPSRKKDRGKQRKAKQKCEEEAARKESKAGEQPPSFEEQGQRKANNIHRNYTADLREIVRRLSDPRKGGKLRDKFLEKSFHTTLLFFFDKCRDKSVPAVVPAQCDVGEGIEVPFLWLGILRLMVRHDGCPDDVLFEVAKSLGPVVEGITNSKRELFQSNTIWYMCLSPFFELVHCITKQSRRGFAEMIAYKGLLPFVAQASCWSVSRTDMVAEAGFLQQPDVFHQNVCHGAQQVIGTVIDAQDQLEGEGLSLPNPIEQIACAPLLSNDPECLDSTVVGLVRMVGYEHQDVDLIMSHIYTLLLDKDYVDAHVIEAVIDIGRRGSARFATGMMCPILGLDREYKHVQPIDSRYAAAIRAGLLEVLTSDHVHDESNMEFAADDAYAIAKGLYAMAGHSKTSRALRGRKYEILEALGPLRKSQSDRSNAICSVIEDAVDYGTPICCNCLKTFDRNLLRFCQGCMIECYCSAACQTESWGVGHSHCCGGLKGEGSNATELKRCNTHRRNLMMNGCRFVKRNIGTLRAMKEEDHTLAVAVHFEVYPPKIRPLYCDDHVLRDLECAFISPLHYGFATRDGGKKALGVKKVIPHSVVAEIESKSPQTTFEARLEGLESALVEQK